MRRTLERTLPLLLGGLALGALGCDDEADDFDLDASIFGDADPADIEAVGYVFVATNDPAGNEVVAYLAFEQGTMVERVRAATGGVGANLTGDSFDPLGSQDSLIAVDDYVFVVNAGSNTVTSFEFDERDPDETPRLERLSVESSGGVGPIAVTFYDDTLYVVNADGTLQGFDVDDGRLTPMSGARASLPSGSIPATIEYRPNGDSLVVTDRMTDRIIVIHLDDDVPKSTEILASAGATPFGAEFTDDDVFAVANANAPGGTPEPDGSTVSTYEIENDEDPPKVIEAGFASNQTAAGRLTWLPGVDWLYTSNQGSQSITALKIDASDGTLDPGATTQTPADSVPLDITILENGEHYLFMLDGGRGTIAMYEIDEDNNGRLIPLNETAVTGLVAGQAYGIDAHRSGRFDTDF